MEWPSEKKLQRLREEGRVPCSSFGSACLLLALFIVFAPDFSALWRSLLEVWLKAWRAPAASGEALLLQAEGAAADLAWIFGAPALLVLGVLFAAGLAQTKFLFQPKLVSFDLSRLAAAWAEGGGLGTRVFRALIVWCLALLIGLGVLSLALPALLAFFEPKGLQVGLWMESFISGLTPPLLMTLGLGALAGMISARLFFLFKHRMSPADLDREDLSSE